MIKVSIGAVVSMWLLSSCSGTAVALNERLSDLSSMSSVGGGCTLYKLGGGSATATSTAALGLTVTQRSDGGNQVSVAVTQGDGTTVAARSYDESFFQSGEVDEFTVPANSGGELLLKYWGTMDSSGTAGCAPLDDNGPEGGAETNDGAVGI